MLKQLMNVFRSELDQKIRRIEKGMEQIIREHTDEKSWVAHYGSTDIDPKHLVFWVCVQSDAEKERMDGDPSLAQQLREQLATHDYPVDAQSDVYIGFESQETVDRVSGGDWWSHWK